MIVQSITQQLKEWENATELSAKEQAKFARLKAFHQLTNLQFYICEEVENYANIDAFVELLRTMGVLCHPHLSIQNMEGTFVHKDEEKGWDNEWIFEFDVNGKEAEFSLSPPKNAGFFEELLDQFNQILQRHGFDKQFRRLNIIGDLLDKPTLEIGLFEPAILEKMMGK